ncbi:lipopolysaccharide biosynthesis protein [Vibrio alginolyticus]|uniref:lipopolysaccharide biosynthesis protein n=1 Tax=Vibrio alginolyticus TaxID=663 RepID=UPI0038CD7628|nr:lipopolysaccharide biosynthesis protein [Vibrio alginolyticus]
MNNFVKQLKIGTKWTVLDKVANQLLKFLVLMVLARLLTPEDFGLVAIAMFFVIICETIVSSGLTHAYINTSENNKSLFFNLVISNLVIGILLTTILIMISSLIEEHYEIIGLGLVIKSLSVIIVLDSFYFSLRAKLEKELEFKKSAFINLPSYFIGAISGVAAAYLGAGYWALVIQLIVYKLIGLGLMLAVFSFSDKDEPKSNRVELRYIRSFFHYGWKLQISAVLNVFSKEMSVLLIGGNLGVSNAGTYSRANNLQNLVMQTVVLVVERVAFPILSKFKDNSSELRGAFALTNRLYGLFLYPLIFLVSLNSNIIVEVIFGPGWKDSAEVLSIIVLCGLTRFMQSTNLTHLKVIGRTDVLLKLRVSEVVITLTFLYFGLKWGIIGLAYAQVISTFTNYLVMAIVSSKYTDFKLVEQISGNLNVLLLSTLLYIVLCQSFDNVQSFYELCLTSTLYLIFYSVGVLFLYKNSRVDFKL